MQTNSVVQPWEANTDTHPRYVISLIVHDLTISATAAFKYRYKTRQGHMEDSLPTLNEDTRTVRYLTTDSQRGLTSTAQRRRCTQVPHVVIYSVSNGHTEREK